MKPLSLFILAAVLALLQQPARGQAGEAVRYHASVLTLPAPMAHGRNLRGMPSELPKAAQPSGKAITHVSVVGEVTQGKSTQQLSWHPQGVSTRISSHSCPRSGTAAQTSWLCCSS